VTDEEREVAPERVAELVGAGETQLVDVRRDDEYEAGHVAEARHLPFDRLTTAADELDRSRTVVFYCRSGDRSAAAADAFAASGWDAHSMAGGLQAWAEAGLPLQPEGGEVSSGSQLPPS
jgi:rhodanese-related sulfurtransferase